MRVLYFGTYERDYPRNAQVVSCLRRAGVEVVEHHVPVWDDDRHKFAPGGKSILRALRAEARLAVANAHDTDALIVGYPGHADVLPAKRAARGRPVVFNPLVSLEDTIVADRGLTSPGSPRARAMRLVDRLAFRAADLVVADTDAHARYFRKRFELSGSRLAVCYVGAEDRLFFPGAPRAERRFHALFIGKLIPLHGLETILQAAARCPGVDFRLVGSGQLEGLLASTPANVTWQPWSEYEQLPDLYRSAGCALGIFGTSDKAARVIPNKAFQALASGAPLVTADTPAARELLHDGRDALLVPAGDPEALAAVVGRLADDRRLAGSIGAEGRRTYEAHASEDVLGARWRSILEKVVHAQRQGAGAG